MYCIRCFRMPDVELNIYIYIWLLDSRRRNRDDAQSRVSFQDARTTAPKPCRPPSSPRNRNATLLLLFSVSCSPSYPSTLSFTTVLWSPRNNSNVGFDSFICTGAAVGPYGTTVAGAAVVRPGRRGFRYYGRKLLGQEEKQAKCETMLDVRIRAARNSLSV